MNFFHHFSNFKTSKEAMAAMIVVDTYLFSLDKKSPFYWSIKDDYDDIFNEWMEISTYEGRGKRLEEKLSL